MRIGPVLSTFLAGILTTMFSGCPIPEPVEFQVAPAIVEVPLGSEFALSVSSSDPLDKKVRCEPDNPLIARANSSAVVHGLRPGTTSLKVSGRHSGASATVDVTVIPPLDFNTKLPEDPAQVQPSLEHTSTLSRIECTLHLPGNAATIKPDVQDLYHRILIPGAERTLEPGKPELPAFTFFAAIPQDAQTGELAQWTITISPELKQPYEGVHVYPAQPPAWIENTKRREQRPLFERDNESYQSGALYPGWEYQSDMVQLGNLNVLKVRVFPVQYIAAEHRLILARRLRIQIDFSSVQSPILPYILGDYKGIQEMGAEEWLATEMLNGELVPLATASTLSRMLLDIDRDIIRDDAFELLIVTRPELYSQARRLARWRQDSGTRVYLASLDGTDYPDAESIRDYIKELDYLNRVPTVTTPEPAAMSAVLLFGDVEFIPAHQGMNYRGQPTPAGFFDYVLTVETDLPYSTLRGGDYEPDVALGRISVDNRDEAKAVVDKVIRYESRAPGDIPLHAATYGYFDDVIWPIAWLLTRLDFTLGSPVVRGVGEGFIGNVLPGDYLAAATSPAEGPPWYRVEEVVSDSELLLSRPYLEAPTPGGDYGGIGRQDGQDDWEFFVGAERVRDFLADQGVTVRFGYNRNDGPDPVADFYGHALPADILAYSWDAGPDTIQANWRQGLEGLVVHCDHGLLSGWHHPNFEMRDSDTDPGHMIPMDDPDSAFYPVVFSMNCDSGWFDNETDTVRFPWGLVQIPQTGPKNECFAERALRFPDGGAVAVIAAARGSDADANDRLLDGLMAALYSNYAEGSISTRRLRPAFDRLGPAFRWGMFHQGNWLGDDMVRREYNLEIYHLHGDPMLKVNLPGS
ncbi:MAG: hypothetical protein AMXMBFR82_08070 [Candidatus Hydrogenedentota bacterium]